MNPYLMVAPALGAVLLDLALAPGAEVFGARPSFTVTLVAVWAALRPRDETLVLAPAAGLLLGLLGNESLGVSLLALAPVALLGRPHEQGSTERRFLEAIAVVVIGTLLYELIHAFLSVLLGDRVPVSPAAGVLLLSVAALNGVLGAMLYFPLALSARGPAPRSEMRRY